MAVVRAAGTGMVKLTAEDEKERYCCEISIVKSA